jgi:hypothetical protein
MGANLGFLYGEKDIDRGISGKGCQGEIRTTAGENKKLVNTAQQGAS